MDPRPVAQSLFPELVPERPYGAFLESVLRGSNADLIATLAPLYLDGCSVLDVTYGRGMWWTRYRPDRFTYHDLALDGTDFTALPYEAGTFDVVTYDPPYVASGPVTSSADVHETRARYGIEQSRSIRGLDELLQAGLAEACRVASRWVLCKCMDYTAGAGLVLGHVKIIGWAEQQGWQVHDLVVHHTQVGPGGWNILTQKRCRRAHSYLLVLTPTTPTRTPVPPIHDGQSSKGMASIAVDGQEDSPI